MSSRKQPGLASCGHPANEDGECDCSAWPERAPYVELCTYQAVFADLTLDCVWPKGHGPRDGRSHSFVTATLQDEDELPFVPRDVRLDDFGDDF